MKQFFSRPKGLLFLLVISTLIFVGGFWVVQGDEQQQGSEWYAEIERLGAQAAYQKMKTINQGNDIETQHLVAHDFGEALFASEGREGIGICDSSFAFGCYHSLFLAAIRQEGLAALPLLDESCVEIHGEKGTGCQHGIGHGVLEYFGPDNLAQALALCGELSWEGTFLGCSSGVFMEYNFPTEIGATTARTTTRLFTFEERFSPCEDLDGAFRLSCYFEIPQWWRPHVAYEEMGTYCGTLLREDERRTCYLGIGSTFALAENPSVERAQDMCTRLAMPEGRAGCLAGVSWGFFSTQKHDDSRAICERALQPEQCIQDSNIEGLKGSV